MTNATRARTMALAWAYGFFAVAGLAGNRAFLLGAAAVAGLGMVRGRKKTPAQT